MFRSFAVAVFVLGLMPLHWARRAARLFERPAGLADGSSAWDSKFEATGASANYTDPRRQTLGEAGTRVTSRPVAFEDASR